MVDEATIEGIYRNIMATKGQASTSEVAEAAGITLKEAEEFFTRMLRRQDLMSLQLLKERVERDIKTIEVLERELGL